ncbi:hypothetical protein Tco_0164010 [Tanacetum coccineum]
MATVVMVVWVRIPVENRGDDDTLRPKDWSFFVIQCDDFCLSSKEITPQLSFNHLAIPQARGGQLNAAPVLEVENFTNWKKSPYIPMAADQRKPEVQWTPNERKNSPNDEEDTRTSYEYLNDLEEEYQARALLAKSKRFFKKVTQRFSSAKVTDQTECHKCGRKGKNKGLIAETYEWDEEEVSLDDNEVTKVKPLLALTTEERVFVGKESASNGEWVKISIQKVHTLLEMEDNDDRKSFLDYLCIDLNYIEEQRNNLLSKHRNLVQELNTCKEQLLVLKQAKLDLLTMQHVNTKILKENQNLRNELKELTSIAETWLNSSNKVNQYNSNMYITSSNKPRLAGAEDSTLPNHDTGKVPSDESQRNTTNPSIAVSDSSATDYDSADESSVCSTLLPPLEKLAGPAKGNISISLSKTNSAHAEEESNLKNPQHVTKNYETCGSNVHTTTDHNDIEWFRKREALQDKKVETFKTRGIRGEIGINTFRNALRTHYLPHSSMYVSPPSITIVRPWFAIIGYSGEIRVKGTLKKSCLPPRPMRFISLLLEYMMPENEELTINPTQVFSVHNWALKPDQTKGPPFTDHIKAMSNLDVPVDPKAPKPSSQLWSSPRQKSGANKKETQSSSAKDKSPSHPSPPTPVVGEMHKEAQQAASGLTSFGATRYNASADSIVEADPGLSPPNDSIPSQQDESEEEEVAKDKDTHASSYDVPEDTSTPHPQSPKLAQIQDLMAQARSSYPDINQLTNLLQYVKDMEFCAWGLKRKFQQTGGLLLPLYLVYILDCMDEESLFGELLVELQALPVLVIQFATVVENVSGAITKDVSSAGQATASPTEGEKNTKDAETNWQ